jgi:hypothetical protein
MEASLFPHQEGSPERLAAEQALGPDFFETAAKGLAPGILGGFTGAHMPNIGAGYRPIAESQALPAAVRRLEKSRARKKP